MLHERGQHGKHPGGLGGPLAPCQDLPRWHRVCQGRGWHPLGDPVQVLPLSLFLQLLLLGVGGEMRLQLGSAILITLSFIQNECAALEFRGILAHIL